MDPVALRALGLGPIDQVGYVVRDLEASLPRYEALFGPFEVAEALFHKRWITGTGECTPLGAEVLADWDRLLERHGTKPGAKAEAEREWSEQEVQKP